MNFSQVISFSWIMLVYVGGSLLILLVSLWFRDWIVKVGRRWKRSTEKKLKLMKEDRWYVILEMMKIVMFLVLLWPMLAIFNYATNENASDPGKAIFNHTMPLVFIVITVWYFLAIIIVGVYQKNKEDVEKDRERRELQGVIQHD